jgi:hypothetical protein
VNNSQSLNPLGSISLPRYTPNTSFPPVNQVPGVSSQVHGMGEVPLLSRAPGSDSNSGPNQGRQSVYPGIHLGTNDIRYTLNAQASTSKPVPVSTPQQVTPTGFTQSISAQPTQQRTLSNPPTTNAPVTLQNFHSKALNIRQHNGQASSFQQ